MNNLLKFMKISNDTQFVIVAVLILVLILYGTVDYDDTDNKKENKRSGLNLYIDNRTGCHYIKGGILGTLILRLDKNGKHICGEQINEIK